MFIGLFVLLFQVYKLVRFYQPDSEDQYLTTRATLTVFSESQPLFPYSELMWYGAAIVAFLLLFGTFGVGLRCFSDFDQGLKSSKTLCE